MIFFMLCMLTQEIGGKEKVNGRAAELISLWPLSRFHLIQENSAKAFLSFR